MSDNALILSYRFRYLPPRYDNGIGQQSDAFRHQLVTGSEGGIVAAAHTNN